MRVRHTQADPARFQLREAATIVLAVFLVYVPALGSGFVFDDWVLLVQQPLTHASDGLRLIWCTTQTPNYYPVTWTSWWLQWQLWGAAPMGYHLINILLHAANAVLVVQVLRRLDVRGAWLAGLVFALHPVNVSSVAWISEHKNMLLMFFFLAAVLAYLRFERGSGWGWYIAALASFLLSLLAKPAAAMWPVVLLGLAWWKKGRVTRHDFGLSLPFFALSLVIGLLSMWMEAFLLLRGDPARPGGFPAKLAGAGWAAWFYLYKALVPLRLCMIYPRWRIDPSQFVVFLPTLSLAAVLIFFWCKRRTWGRNALAGGGYYLLMLFPVLGFIDQSFFPISFVADHYQYVAIPGLIALVVGAAVSLVAKGPDWMRPAGRVAAPAVIVCLGLLTLNQSRAYFSDETLWRDTIAKNPAAWLAHYNLGVRLAERGEVAAAAASYEAAVRLKPDYADALSNLGTALLQQGRVEEALSRWRTVIRFQPDHVETLNNLGAVYAQQSDFKRAALYFSLVLALKPNQPEAHANLGAVYLSEGKLTEAAGQLATALRLEPRLTQARLYLGQVQARLGMIPQAVQTFQEALRFEPANQEAQAALRELGAQGR